MARTHPFAEAGARPKPHATEGVTTASMPPATPAVEDEMLIPTAPFAIGSRMSVPNPSADQFAPRPTQVRETTPGCSWPSSVRRSRPHVSRVAWPAFQDVLNRGSAEVPLVSSAITGHW